ncbi:MAG TPA: hypothetical protein VFK94_06670 [Patescibacteria group bacterium]|nr:hypothetical protein [Patescibacteria group bacterium]
MIEMASRATKISKEQTDRGCQAQLFTHGVEVWTQEACNDRPSRIFYVPVLAGQRVLEIALCAKHNPEVMK